MRTKTVENKNNIQLENRNDIHQQSEKNRRKIRTIYNSSITPKAAAKQERYTAAKSEKDTAGICSKI